MKITALRHSDVIGMKKSSVKEYLIDAFDYWIKSGSIYEKMHQEHVAVQGDNKAYIFIKINNKTLHISRFIVEKKGDGLGSIVIKDIQNDFDKITLWSNPKAMKFYERNGIIFQPDKTVDVDGVIYTYGEWNK